MAGLALTIKNRLGLHGRAAAKLAQAVAGFAAEVRLAKGGASADAKSVLDLVALGCPFGTEVALSATGPEAAKALAAAAAAINGKFGEE